MVWYYYLLIWRALKSFTCYLKNKPTGEVKTCTHYLYMYTLPLHVHITFTCTHYHYMYTLPLHVHITFTCTHYLYMYTLPLHVHITFTCTHYLYMYTLPLHVHITFTCTHYLYMCTSPLHVHITFTCTHYLYMYTLPLHVHCEVMYGLQVKDCDIYMYYGCPSIYWGEGPRKRGASDRGMAYVLCCQLQPHVVISLCN